MKIRRRKFTNAMQTKFDNRRVTVATREDGILVEIAKYKQGLTEVEGVGTALVRGCVQYVVMPMSYEAALALYQNLEVILKQEGKL